MRIRRFRRRIRAINWESLAFVMSFICIVSATFAFIYHGQLKDAQRTMIAMETNRTAASNIDNIQKEVVDKSDKNPPYCPIKVSKCPDEKPIPSNSVTTSQNLDSIPELPALPQLAMSCTTTKRDNTRNCWIEIGKKALEGCHRGMILGHANLLKISSEHCDLAEIEPRFSEAELNKYLAQESLAMCREGKYKPYAKQLYLTVFGYKVDCQKIDPSLSEEEVVSFLENSEKKLTEESIDSQVTAKTLDQDTLVSTDQSDLSSQDTKNTEISIPSTEKTEADKSKTLSFFFETPRAHDLFNFPPNETKPEEKGLGP